MTRGAKLREPMQAITLETATQSTLADAPNGLLIQSPLGKTAHLLINSAQIDLSGAAYITATSDSNLVVRGLQGHINMTVGGKTVVVLGGSSAQVPLSGLAANGAPSEPEPVGDVGNQLDLLNSLVYGQPYNGAGSTLADFSIRSGPQTVAADGLMRLNLSYTGDAATCPVAERPLLDVVFAIDSSTAMVGSKLDSAKVAIGHFVAGMNPDTDQVGVVSFAGQATLLSPLSVNLSAAVNKLQDIKTENARAIDIGLGAAYSALKSGRADAAVRAIVLITGGSSDAISATQVANTIKQANIRIITVGIGDDVDAELLNNLATEDDALLAKSAINLSDVLETSLFKLTQPIAARNLKVNLKVDTKQFAVVEDLLAASGSTLKGDTLQWDVPAVWNTQTVNFTTVLKALKSGDVSPGTVDVSYATCASGSGTESKTITAPTISVGKTATSESITPDAGILTDSITGKGTLAAFGQQVWALNASDTQTVSVTTSGTQAPLSALLTSSDGTVIDPLYTLPGSANGEGDLSVFFVPNGGISWLYLSSNSANAAGNYDIKITSQASGSSAEALAPDGPPINVEQPKSEGQIYDLDGKAGETLTFHYVAQGNAPLDSPLRVFSLDGQMATDVFTQFDTATNEWISLQTLEGAGPYRALVRSTAPYSLGVDSGDTLTNTRGAITLGETRTTDAKNSKPAIFSYDLTVPDDNVVSVILSGSANQSIVRNTDNKIVERNDLLKVNDFNVNFYNLVKGSYTLLVPITRCVPYFCARG